MGIIELVKMYIMKVLEKGKYIVIVNKDLLV